MNRQSYFSHETAVIDEDVEIGQGTKIWHFSHIMPNASIGAECNIGQNVYIDSGVEIGKNVKIQNNVNIYKGVTLGDGVFCGPSMVFTNVNRPRSNYPKDESDYLETHVSKGATIGANATIICGNDLGKYSFVGAGSVITESVKPYSLIYGNPGRMSGWVCECGNIKSEVNEFKTWTCGQCGTSYELKESELTKLGCSKGQ